MPEPAFSAPNQLSDPSIERSHDMFQVMGEEKQISDAVAKEYKEFPNIIGDGFEPVGEVPKN